LREVAVLLELRDPLRRRVESRGIDHRAAYQKKISLGIDWYSRAKKLVLASSVDNLDGTLGITHTNGGVQRFVYCRDKIGREITVVESVDEASPANAWIPDEDELERAG
jgi:hypothetical protein